MNQIALARRYRPRSFQTMVGQEATLRALTNALTTQRLHHAYLFTGTKGIGKTTLARILAKCLNCEQGITATPCSQCSSCNSIDEGRSPDVLEVDAASRTKVEDTREILDNVQYLPTRARFKIYIIDEVHMLSTHSFNALLKTLEEPPSHVKFILATTDPEKLPMTVLSRCLQFYLRRLTSQQIVKHLKWVLEEEKQQGTEEALQILATYAEGSMRDALSLLDQSLAYCQGSVEAEALRHMLGLSSRGKMINLMAALINSNAEAVMQEIAHLAEGTLDFKSVLTEFLSLIHQIALAQKIPEALEDNILDRDKILQLATQTTPEAIQLYYQIGLMGQRDLPYAPSGKMGFEMILLRMLAFQPVSIAETDPSPKLSKLNNEKLDNELPKKNAVSKQEMPTYESSSIAMKPQAKSPHASVKLQQDNTKISSQEISNRETPHKKNALTDWSELLEQLKLTGLVKELAQHCTLAAMTEGHIHLILEESQKPLLNKRNEERLQEAITQYFGNDTILSLKITIGKPIGITPALQNKHIEEQNFQKAKRAIESDPKVQHLMQTFNAEIENISIIDE